MDEPLLCPCRVRIVTHLNDGTEVSPEKMAEILSVFARQFGAYSVLGAAEGHWENQKEPSTTVEVAIKEEQKPLFLKVVNQIGRELGQKAMYVDMPAPSVRIMSVD